MDLQKRNFQETAVTDKRTYFEPVGGDEVDDGLETWDVFADHDLATSAFKEDLEERCRGYKRMR